MKTIRIQQPYASLICAGIQTELFVDEPEDFRGRVLILSGNIPFSDEEAEIQMPRKQYNLLDNAMKFDALPGRDMDLFTDAAIGTVEIKACVDAESVRDSIWKKDGCKYCLRLNNAMEFDSPICLQPESGTDTELEAFTESNLPSMHVPFRLNGWKDGSFYFVKVKDETIDELMRDMHADEPYDFHNILISPLPELGLTSDDCEYIKKDLQYFCFTSDSRFILAEVALRECFYDNTIDDNDHTGDPDYLCFDIFFKARNAKIYSLDILDKNKDY